MITPVDLETTVFHRGLHGYHVNEVQEFMAQISQDYEKLYKENIDLKEKIENLESKISQYQMIEETLRNTMILAQETAEEVKKTARDQADLIVREAQQQEESIKVKIKEEIQTELRNLALLKNQGEYFKCQFKSFLNGLLELADKQLDLKIVWDGNSKVMVADSDNSEHPEVAAAAEENPGGGKPVNSVSGR